jgi:hypothetical protein
MMIAVVLAVTSSASISARRRCTAHDCTGRRPEGKKPWSEAQTWHANLPWLRLPFFPHPHATRHNQGQSLTIIRFFFILQACIAAIAIAFSVLTYEYVRSTSWTGSGFSCPA